jgi:hypothetical protein
MHRGGNESSTTAWAAIKVPSPIWTGPRIDAPVQAMT